MIVRLLPSNVPLNVIPASESLSRVKPVRPVFAKLISLESDKLACKILLLKLDEANLKAPLVTSVLVFRLIFKAVFAKSTIVLILATSAFTVTV